ncbi:Os07g0243125 [Oryza sativa Japonica Group]|uniref:Os07g0243125 protein n=1 Tax=Oryza sativa subsp. japonica TaxID=39947 RepID=A0A0P0X518_ORYSJ|nr:Os07g0243125 [Oryza sativa Japonica Group]
MRRGGGVLGTNKVYFLIEEQHAGGYIFGMERHPNDGFVLDSKDEAHGGILNTELPPLPPPPPPTDDCFIPNSEDEANWWCPRLRAAP